MMSSSWAAACLAVWIVHAGGLQRFEAVEPHMGTLVRITLYAPDAQQATVAFRAAFSRIAALDDALSDYKPDSELNRVTREPAGQPVRVSSDLFSVLTASQNLAEETNGAFDVTLGPVIRLWRAARKTWQIPDTAAIRQASARCGFRKLHLDAVNQTVTLDDPEMQLDAGGIAKGYAADAALAVLDRLGIRRALVVASGDLAIGDPPPGKRGWRVGVDDRILELRNTAVSTSGDAEQHVDIGGTRYSHIIDPATAMALTNSIRVTIIAPHGIDADSLATALSVLGPERGIALVQRRANTFASISSAGHRFSWPASPPLHPKLTPRVQSEKMEFHRLCGCGGIGRRARFRF